VISIYLKALLKKFIGGRIGKMVWEGFRRQVSF
jgi:hypothetical protein